MKSRFVNPEYEHSTDKPIVKEDIKVKSILSSFPSVAVGTHLPEESQERQQRMGIGRQPGKHDARHLDGKVHVSPP